MRCCSDTDIDLYLITKGHRVKLMLGISSSPDPTSKQAHINLGHFQAEVMQRNTNASHSTRNKLDNKKNKKDFELKYERLCRGETRKVGINFFFYTTFD